MTAVLEESDNDWPPAVSVVNEGGRSDIVLICEHASSHIPAEYGDLGLGVADRLRHIAWDIGAADVARGLAVRLDAPAFLCNYSRLLIDLNRPLGTPGSIPEYSDGTRIPGNAGIEERERRRRAEKVFTPFHNRIARYLCEREKAGQRLRIVAVHSFTPVFSGEARPWHAGVLYGKSEGFAKGVIEALRRDPCLSIGINAPYVISREEDYAIPVHGEDRGHEAILIEVRQDLISSADGVDIWVEKLGDAIAGMLSPSQPLPAGN